MQKYIADDKVILCAQGLRWVKKDDLTYAGNQPTYRLSWNYKGSEAAFSYDNQAERDAMYDKVVKALKVSE